MFNGHRSSPSEGSLRRTEIEAWELEKQVESRSINWFVVGTCNTDIKADINIKTEIRKDQLNTGECKWSLTSCKGKKQTDWSLRTVAVSEPARTILGTVMVFNTFHHKNCEGLSWENREMLGLEGKGGGGKDDS